MVEQVAPSAKNSKVTALNRGTRGEVVSLNKITTQDELRFDTGMGELDRVLGGGAVKGSLVLIGGEPGIGKSTILLQICNHLCRNLKVLYISGEESKRQLKLRAERLGVESENLLIYSETDIEDILETAKSIRPDVVIVDSIQTVYRSDVSSAPGSVAQVRECTMALMGGALGSGIALMGMKPVIAILKDAFKLSPSVFSPTTALLCAASGILLALALGFSAAIVPAVNAASMDPQSAITQGEVN